MKGQYLTIEYLLFFMIGVFMIVSVYFSFSNMNEMYKSSITQDQLRMTGELISGTIINLYEISNSTNSSLNYSLSIPTKLSNCIYAINVTSIGLALNCTNVPNTGVALTLYNFNISNKNIIYSTNGLLKLSVKDNKVELS
jgi:hypothetical protein